MITPKLCLSVSSLLVTGVLMAGCEKAANRTVAPPANDPNSYMPVAQHKPLPGDEYAQVQYPPQPQPAYPQPQPVYPQPQPQPQPQPVYPQPQPPVVAPTRVGLPAEEAYVKGYQNRRSPRIMVFVNRSLTGDPLPADKLAQMAKSDTNSVDIVGATATDYEAMEISMIDYLNAGGQIDIRDSEMLRSKLDRETVLRLENGDRSVLPILKKELQTDIVVNIKATPTQHSTYGNAVRLLCKTMGTTDGRILASTYVDMPLPMTKTNINVFTKFMANKTMEKLGLVWSGQGGAWDPIELRIYKAADLDHTMMIRNWLLKTPGIKSVVTRGATSSSTNGYATMAVQYDGAPEDLYMIIKTALDSSTGVKAVDVQNNTLNLEMTGGPLDLKPVPVPAPVAPVTPVTPVPTGSGTVPPPPQP